MTLRVRGASEGMPCVLRERKTRCNYSGPNPHNYIKALISLIICQLSSHSYLFSLNLIVSSLVLILLLITLLLRADILIARLIFARRLPSSPKGVRSECQGRGLKCFKTLHRQACCPGTHHPPPPENNNNNDDDDNNNRTRCINNFHGLLMEVPIKGKYFVFLIQVVAKIIFKIWMC